MKTVIIAENPFNTDEYKRFNDVDNIYDFLIGHFKTWDNSIRVYLNHVSESTDITPVDEVTLNNLDSYEGLFIVIRYPAVQAIVIIVVAVVVGVAVALMMAPAIPTLRNTQSQSPNNELQQRTNRPRPNARIPDIFGETRCTPDALTEPYAIFINHQEVEIGYMCVGRGSYLITADEVKDDTTRLNQIPGSAAEFYAPNTSPNSGHQPQLRIGTPINRELEVVKKSNSVNGQVLRGPNDRNYSGSSNIEFVFPNIINVYPVAGNNGPDMATIFDVGDVLTIANATLSSPFKDERTISCLASAIRFIVPNNTVALLYQNATKIKIANTSFSKGGTPYNINGEYNITSVTVQSETVGGLTTYYTVINLDNPVAINAAWSNDLTGVWFNADHTITNTSMTLNLNGDYTVSGVSASQITLSNPAIQNFVWERITVTNRTSAVLETMGDKWVGPFIIDDEQTTGIYANFVAPNGMYKDNGENQWGTSVTVEVELTPVNALDVPTGAPITVQGTVEGSAYLRTTRAYTVQIDGLTPSRYSVRARRVTPNDTGFKGTVVDETRWRDVYSRAPVNKEHFGNVTTVQTMTFATTGALTLKQRKLNCLAIRNVRSRDIDGNITESVFPSKRVSDIFITACLDPYIGNRNVNEIDVDNIYNTENDIIAYFGSEKAAQFCYTFDSDNISTQETLQTIANAIFCEAYRIGNIVRLFFEKKTENSVLLFNHRNKVIGSETRQLTLGNINKYDGVSYRYVDPKDDALVTIYIPSDQSATTPKEVESVGVRNHLQAYFHCQRIWNKIQHQRISVDFKATQEGDLLIKGNRILNTDSTRLSTQEGYVVKQTLLVLTLSQPVIMDEDVDYNITLQIQDASVEIMRVYPTANPKQVILEKAPKLPLVLNRSNYLQTSYIITRIGQQDRQAFLVTSRKSNNDMTTSLTAINYSDRYYASDDDYKTLTVDENGKLI